MRSILFLSIPFLFLSCKGKTESGKTDQELIEESVRNYFFLDDSSDVQVEVLDTIFIEELDEMLDKMDENLRLVQLDIDTLSSIIDSTAYDNLEYEKRLYPESIDEKMALRRLELSKYQLKMADLNATKLEYRQYQRVMLNLRRSQFNQIAGYEVGVSYDFKGETYLNDLVMDADFRVID